MLSFLFFPFSVANIDQTICSECIDVLAAVCETTSLASLSLYFPPQKIWQFEMLNVRGRRKVFSKKLSEMSFSESFSEKIL